MKTLLVAVLMGISSILSGCSSAFDYPRYSTAQRQESMFPRNLVIFLKIGDSGNCSGVIVGKDTVLTAGHCVVGEQITVGDVPAKVLKVDKEKDLALLTVPGISCPCAPIEVKNLQIDSPIVTIGFPLGGPQIATEGRVQTTWVDEMPIYEVITSPVSYGNSGGGVFQKQDGEWVLVGILSAVATVDAGFFRIPVSHLALAVRGDVIGEFIK